MKKYYFIILIISALHAKSSDDIQKEIDTNNKTLKQLEQTINNLEKDLENMESSEKDLTDYIKILDEKIITREKQIEVLIAQNNRIFKLIENSKNNIKVKDDELSKLKKQLKKRATYLYKNGKDKIISKIMLSENWSAALNKLKYLKILLEYEKQLNNNIKLKIKELKKEKYNLENDQKNQKSILNEAQIIHKSLKKDRNTKNQQIGKIKTDKDYLKKDLKSKKKKISDIEELINKLILDVKSAKQREAELAKKRASQNKATSGNFAKMKGKLNYPASGQIVNNFGTHRNKKLSTITENIGIDIESKWNTPVYSVLDGVVSIITYLRSYGNTIIISHGSGYFTVYANVDQISVKENEYILGNTQLGFVGKSENPAISDSYFLHFEIRKDETILNPELWLKKQ